MLINAFPQKTADDPSRMNALLLAVDEARFDQIDYAIETHLDQRTVNLNNTTIFLDMKQAVTLRAPQKQKRLRAVQGQCAGLQ